MEGAAMEVAKEEEEATGGAMVAVGLGLGLGLGLGTVLGVRAGAWGLGLD